MKLENIKTQTTWNDAAERINHNNLKIATELAKLGASTYKNKGYFASAESLISAYPSASAGSIAYVGSSYPYTIYTWNGNAWVNSGETGGDESVNLGDYYTKEETERVVEEYHTVLTQEQYDSLGSYEDKLYFCTED